MAARPLEDLLLDLFRRERSLTEEEILGRVPEAERARVPDLLRRFEEAGLILRHENRYYDLQTLGRFLRPGRIVTPRDLSVFLGIPFEAVRESLIPWLLRREILVRIAEEEYQVVRLYRVQKFRVYRTTKNPQFYQVRFHERIQVPRQLVLEGFAPREETDELAVGTIGAIRIVVYTFEPWRWTEEVMERIMTELIVDQGITFEFAPRNVNKYQAYEVREVEPDEKPPDVDIDEPQVFLWVSKDGEVYVYEYTRRPWGWSYRRFRVV